MGTISTKLQALVYDNIPPIMEKVPEAPQYGVCIRYGDCVCLYHAVVQGMVAMFAFVVWLCKVWWLCLPLPCGCTRYGGCVCLCYVVVQGTVAVFAFVVWLYKVWWLCLPLPCGLPLSCGCTKYGGCVCLCHEVVQVRWLCLPLSCGCTSTVAVFAFANTVRWLLDRSCSGHGLFNECL